MQERTLDNLILNDEDYIFAGDLTIKGTVDIKNGSLIVSGRLEIKDTVTVVGGDIVAGELNVHLNINIKDGDIIVYGDFEAYDIYSDGNIEVSGDSNVANVTCFNYLIAGDNDSQDVNAIQDIYILGDNDSCSLKGRDIFIDGNSFLFNSPIIAKSFYHAGKLDACSSISVV